MRLFITALIGSFLFFDGHAQNFTNMTPPDFGSSPYSASTKWGDLDNDGILELVSTGVGPYDTRVTMIMYLQSGAFSVKSTTDFGGGTQISFNNLDFGDYDGDGDLDILVLGEPSTHLAFTVVRNDGNLNFVKAFDLTPGSGTAYWRDVNNDGTLDALYSNADAGIYLNQQGAFANQITLNPTYRIVTFQSAADIDSDGDLDIIQSRRINNYGSPFDGNYLLMRNADGTYTESKITAMPLEISQAEFADNDGDGDLDVLVKTFGGPHSIYKFESGNFVNTNISLPNANNSKWADFNNDGYPDIIFTGIDLSFMNFVTRIYYSNAGTSFTDSGITELPGFNRSTVSVGDYDRDGDPDVALAGDNAGAIYRNNWVENSHATNNAPGAPTPTGVSVTFNAASFQWNDGTDDNTPASSLSYDLEVKRNDGVVSKPGSYIPGSFRTLYQPGNVDLTNTYTIGCLQEGTYTWKVQAVDNSFQGSPFASGPGFTISNIKPVAPSNVKATAISDRRIMLTWNDLSTTETSYVIERKVKNDPYPMFYRWAEIAANSTTFTDTTANSLNEYVYRVTAKNCSYPTEYAVEVEGKSLPPFFVNATIASLPANAYGTRAALGDFDNDRDLDLFMEYSVNSVTVTRSLLKSQNGQFVSSGIDFPVADPLTGVQWLDFNKDGYLDLIMTFSNYPISYKVDVYQNAAGSSFTKTTSLTFSGIKLMSSFGPVFADYDNDGDLDALIEGMTPSNLPALKIFANDGVNSFTDSGIAIDGNVFFIRSSTPWGDFNNDGYLDLLVARTVDCFPQTRILKNNAGKSFTETNVGITDGLWGGNDGEQDAKWVDYDNDGYLDVILMGPGACNTYDAKTNVFRNNHNGTFSKLATTFLTMTSRVSVQTVDFNNDGFADIFTSGSHFYNDDLRNRLYFNDQGNFSNSKFSYITSSTGDMIVGDVDNDMDLDYIRLGYPTAIRLFTNNYSGIWGAPNHVPLAPGNLQGTVTDNSITLSWSPAVDAETASAGLTYNIYLTNATDTLISPASHRNGYRKIVAPGNVQATTITFNGLPPGTYSWGVQAIDKSYAGGAFSTKQSFVVTKALPPPATPPGATTGIEPDPISFTYYPNPVTGGSLNIEVDVRTEVGVFETAGRQLYSTVVDHDEVIPMTQWVPGVYIVKYSNQHGNGAVKIIKR